MEVDECFCPETPSQDLHVLDKLHYRKGFIATPKHWLKCQEGQEATTSLSNVKTHSYTFNKCSCRRQKGIPALWSEQQKTTLWPQGQCKHTHNPSQGRSTKVQEDICSKRYQVNTSLKNVCPSCSVQHVSMLTTLPIKLRGSKWADSIIDICTYWYAGLNMSNPAESNLDN